MEVGGRHKVRSEEEGVSIENLISHMCAEAGENTIIVKESKTPVKANIPFH